jgi:catechol-2,3-dioxygenase
MVRRPAFRYPDGTLPKPTLGRLAAIVFVLVTPRAVQAAEPLPITAIAGVTFRAHDLAGMRNYYGKRAGFREVLPARPGSVRLGVGPEQWLEFQPGAGRGYVVRFQSLTLVTPSLRALDAKLRERGAAPVKGAGGRSLELRDPAGNLLIFIEARAKARKAARTQPGFAQHLQHIGLTVQREQRAHAESFYRDTLGLTEVFRMGDGLIKYKLNGDRFDVVELIFTSGPLNKWAAGSIAHINFAVDDIEKTYCDLFNRGLVDEDRFNPKVNAERLWAIDMFDPELTRVEIQEPKPAAEEIQVSKDPACSGPAEPLTVFNGKNLDGWSGEEGLWRVENGTIVGEARGFQHYNTWLWHDTAILKDFYLSVWIRQEPARDRSGGVQFRSQQVDLGNQARGYRAVIGGHLWGTLFHEKGREGLFTTDAGEKAARGDDWNHYEVLAVGHRIWTAVNGTVATHVEDPKGERAGKLALELHFGGPQTVRFRDLKVIRNPPIALQGHDEAALVKMLVPVKAEKPAKAR